VKVLAPLLFILCFSFLGCVPEQPIAESSTSPLTEFSHDGLEGACTGCHLEKRPSEEHNRNMQCDRCHVTRQWDKNIDFDHTPKPKDCKLCHLEQRPETSFGNNTLEVSVHGQGFNCKKCHSVENWKEGISYSHDPNTGKKCYECHSEKRPAVSKFPKPKHQVKVGHYETKDCSSCHKTETNKNEWYFDHSDSKDRDIKFCLPCHKTAGKRKHFYAIPFGGFRGDGNCYKCHNKKRQSWKAK
jgi:hypothetical protein